MSLAAYLRPMCFTSAREKLNSAGSTLSPGRTQSAARISSKYCRASDQNKREKGKQTHLVRHGVKWAKAHRRRVRQQMRNQTDGVGRRKGTKHLCPRIGLDHGEAKVRVVLVHRLDFV